MKLTDPDIIKEGEKDLIDAIKGDLDLDAIKEIVKEKLKVKNLESKGGKIIVHNNKIAFKLEFELSLSGSLMFDRDGNYIPDSHDDSNTDDSDADDIDDASKESESELPEIEKEKNREELDDKKSDSKEDIAQELIADDDLDDDLDDDDAAIESSELDLDVENFEDDEDGLDFSDDEDIDDILKESREFWEKKK